MSTATLTAPEIPPLIEAPPETTPTPVPLPPEPPGDILYEVVDGQIQEKAVGIHQSLIAGILVEFLAPFVRAHKLGRVIPEGVFLIDRQTGLQRRPDVAFVSKSRWPLKDPLPDTAAWQVAPDLAIEVNSPTNTAVEVLRKIHEYFKAGVTRVWMVFPSEQEVYVYSSPQQIQVLAIDQSLEDEPLFPGFSLPLTTLFEVELEPTTQSPANGNS
jgi:Uma2 family endonuclease